MLNKETGRHNVPMNYSPCYGNSWQYIHEALQTGKLSGDGPFSESCRSLLKDILNVSDVMLTPSGTHALELAALLLGIQPGDEVIVPSFTFSSTANAFLLQGAQIVFCDIRPDTLNLDERHIAQLLTPRTKAIVAVHYAGVPCEINTLLEVAKDRGVHLIEDNAHGLFGSYESRYLGTFGVVSAHSFHETKSISCGEGGALMINDPELVQQAEIIRDKGLTRPSYLRGESADYTWVDRGSSYILSDILAAALYAQLEQWEELISKREKSWHIYMHGLRDWAIQNGVQLPPLPSNGRSAYHIFYLILPSKRDREELQAFLHAVGIASAPHFVALHLSPMGRHLGGMPGDCPTSEDLSERLLRLPLFNGMTAETQERIIQAVHSYSCRDSTSI